MKNNIKKFFIMIGIITICYVVYISIDIYLYGNNNEVLKADAAIVLGTGIWGTFVKSF